MRRVLVTGTSRGLGRFLAEHFLAHGDAVTGCSRGQGTITHERYTHHQADVSAEADVRRLADDIRARHGGLDVLINSAGTASMNAFALTPVASIRRVTDTNFVGAATVTHAAIRLLRRSTIARIVNLTSIAVPERLAGEAVYAASKAAIEMFTRVLAKEIGPMGMTCNAVGPSVIRTAMTAGIAEEKLQRLVGRQAVAGEATAADVANVVDFLVRPESRLITGQVIYLGGFG